MSSVVQGAALCKKKKFCRAYGSLPGAELKAQWRIRTWALQAELQSRCSYGDLPPSFLSIEESLYNVYSECNVISEWGGENPVIHPELPLYL